MLNMFCIKRISKDDWLNKVEKSRKKYNETEKCQKDIFKYLFIVNYYW
jgi:hypothetical protein